MGRPIYAVWLAVGNTEGEVTPGYGMDLDFFEGPPTFFASQISRPEALFGRGAQGLLFNDHSGLNEPMKSTMPWFRGKWHRAYARPIATFEQPDAY